MTAPGGLHAAQQRVAAYYGGKVARFGPTPLGVDWTCEPTQQLRFVQLLKVIEPGSHFTINDFGCGYGALLPFLRQRRLARDFDYLGLDIAQPMIDAARALHARRRNARFECGETPSCAADYSVASGIFNVRLDVPDAQWRGLVMRTLRIMAASSTRAFAVNFLQPVPKDVASPPELYRPGAQEWRRWCEKEFGWRCEVLSGYGLREFTLHCFSAATRGPARSALPA